MTRALATDLAADGILVNCVSPGFVLTDLTRQSLTSGEIQALAKQVPLGRFAETEEIAGIITLLVENEKVFANGSNIVYDGGFTMTVKE